MFAAQGAQDHIDRLQGQVESLETCLRQTRATVCDSESHSPETQAELAHMRVELAESQNMVSQLQRKLQEEQAEVLMLKESQGGSNKASDVIQALESQVNIIPKFCSSLLLHTCFAVHVCFSCQRIMLLSNV